MGIPKTDSLVEMNNTLHDYPELNYYYTGYFLKNVEIGDEYKGIVFELDWMMNFLKHDKFHEDSILNINSMEFFYKYGEIYDKSKNLNDLKKV